MTWLKPLVNRHKQQLFTTHRSTTINLLACETTGDERVARASPPSPPPERLLTASKEYLNCFGMNSHRAILAKRALPHRAGKLAKESGVVGICRFPTAR